MAFGIIGVVVRERDSAVPIEKRRGLAFLRCLILLTLLFKVKSCGIALRKWLLVRAVLVLLVLLVRAVLLEVVVLVAGVFVG